MDSLSVIFEDNHLLVVNKPAGVATMGTDASTPSVARTAAAYIKKKYNKRGNSYIGIVSRLDRLVSGVVVFAKTSKAAARLSQQFRQRSTVKRYLTVVSGASQLDGSITLEHFVRKNERRQRMEIAPRSDPQAQLAQLRTRTIVVSEGPHPVSLLEVELLTGRKHQIRLQLQALGFPILGDAKYGSQAQFPSGIALHSHRLSIAHPTLHSMMTFKAIHPNSWNCLPRELRSALADLANG